MSNLRLEIFLIGDTSRPEFHDACAAMDGVARVTRFASVDAATAALQMTGEPMIAATGKGTIPFSPDRKLGRSPHAIVLIQAYPGQFAAAAVKRLRAAAPLARIVAVLGSWCEGEPRSGTPLPGVARVYWHEAAARFRRELPRWFDADSPWSLPATATDEERLLAAGAAPLACGTGLVAIWSRRPEMAELLADACRGGGYAAVWLHPRSPGKVQGAVAAIFDGDLLGAAALDELKLLAAMVSPARVLTLLPSPRIQDIDTARSIGAAVLAKPFRVDDLLFALGELHAFA